ncbi:hypothetical protein NEOLEDRAFT_1174412 [Neolentinus lepideus HHB14362 ss-1]|uniref:F-box domain-containing protein n=1 Tax=Neolentinus lepideus HHB14362 ss-1 TaxID=1314782 RepID=A0A165VRE9_9AGAM|nr:hypothetical protein NEOLEDRAFT_1174412 [Neolentinus lepideus HHB14362 ss-1]
MDIDRPRLRLDTLCGDVLTRIAYYVSTSTIAGPPVDLVSLLLTSKSINISISLPANWKLLADTFKAKFDVQAVHRRLPARWFTDHCLGKELMKRCQMLQRMRRSQIDSLEQLSNDFWTAYLMMLEHDEHNRAQLVHWGRIHQYLWHVILWSFRTRSFDWFSNSEIASLIVWLFWTTMDRDDLMREDPRLRMELQKLLHPFIVANYKYPSFHATDYHQLLPLCPNEIPPPPPPKDPKSYQMSPVIPHVRTITHYSHPLTIACPPLTGGAILCSSARTEVQLALDTAARTGGWRACLPRGEPVQFGMTRAQRDAAGRDGPTFEDIDDFESGMNVRCPRRDGSEHWEQLWYRLVGCWNPWDNGGTMRGVVYEFGQVAGRWRGRMLVPSQERFFGLVAHEAQNSRTPSHIRALEVHVMHRPLYVTLKEHHCLAHEDALDFGEDEWGNDLLNAWLPRGSILREREDHLEIYDPIYDRIIRYETLAPPSSSHRYLCKSAKQTSTWVEDEPESDSETAISDGVDPSYIDSDEYEDTLTQVASNVSDIIITGETERVHGTAWGHYTFVGRVRPWDGLVCLVRRPTNANQAHLGPAVFRGYVQGDNFVGQWRDLNSSLDVAAFECGFVMTRVES